MAGYKVEICGVNTATLPLLKNSEKEQLLVKIKNGDTQARQDFIKGNLRLVLSVVQRFTSSTENIDDLFQIGCIGMIKAIDNFDLSQNVQFSTYAVPMISGEIKRYLRDNSAIRVSRSLRDTAYKALYAKEKLQNKTNKEPTISEISQEIGIPKEDIVLAMEAIQSPVSLYEPIYNDNGDTLYVMDQVSDQTENEESWVSHMALTDAYNKLSPREKTIIKMRYFQCKTQMETANELSISQAQVSRLEKCALKTMKKYMS